MPLTNSGIWYPDGNFTANPRVIAAQQAANLESVISTERLRHGSTNYASVTDRDAANPTPQVGDRCSVLGWPQVYYSIARGWVDQELRNMAAFMEVTQATTVTVPNITWTYFSPTTVVEQINPPNQNIFTIGATGIIFNKPGFYDIYLSGQMGNATSGRRLVGWSTATTAPPTAQNEMAVPTVGGGQYYSIAFGSHITDANGRILMWMYQDSGSSIGANNIRVKAYYRSGLG